MEFGKVNFALVSNRKTANETYYFIAEEGLVIGDIIMVESNSGLVHANFLGYTDELPQGIEPFREIIKKADTYEIEQYWQQVEENLIKSKLGITKNALHSYRTGFKGNTTISKNDAIKKLTRNILLSTENRQKGINRHGAFTFYYGFQIIRVKDGIIIGVSNAKRAIAFKKDWNKYLELNKKLGIKLTEEEQVKYGLIQKEGA